MSPNFQPFTSYRWPKKTKAVNPYQPPAEERLHKLQAELKTAPAERKRELRSIIDNLRAQIDTMTKYSFLIGATDPFIVIPIGFAKHPDSGKIGDYAMVIYGEKIYPAIVGDAGPPEKVGEASLRIAKEISGVATPLHRPVSDLKATYLIFPGTAEKLSAPPDLDKIHTRCEELVKEIGGASVPLHRWVNIIPPPPTPTPVPTPTPTPTPEESPIPSPSPSATFAFPTTSPSPTSTPTSSPTLTPTPTPNSSPAESPSPTPAT